MKIDANVNMYNQELTIKVGNKVMVIDFEELPLVSSFEFRGEVFDFELEWNGQDFSLWIEGIKYNVNQN